MEHIQQKHQIWNHFDDLALLLGIKRNPGEDNFELRKRILECYKNTPNSSLQGLTNALNRDLGYPTYNTFDKKIFILDFEPLIDYPITIQVDNTTYNTQVIEQFPLQNGWVFPSGITDPAPPTFTGAAASGLSQSWILWRYPNGEYSRLLEFISSPPTDSKVKIEYSYRLGETIYKRVDQDFDILNKDSDEIYNLKGLFTGYSSLTANPSGHVKVFALNDSDFIKDPSNGFWTIEGTATDKLEAVVNRIRQAAPIFWDEFIADESYWDAGSYKFSGIESLPVIFDANVSGYYRSIDNYYGNYKSDYQSGIGYGKDLYASHLIKGHFDIGDLHIPKIHVDRSIY